MKIKKYHYYKCHNNKITDFKSDVWTCNTFAMYNIVVMIVRMYSLLKHIILNNLIVCFNVGILTLLASRVGLTL